MPSKFTGTWINEINRAIFTITDGQFVQSYKHKPGLYFYKGTWIPDGENKIILTYTHENEEGAAAPENMPPITKDYKNWFFEIITNDTMKLIAEGLENIYGNSELDSYSRVKSEK